MAPGSWPRTPMSPPPPPPRLPPRPVATSSSGSCRCPLPLQCQKEEQAWFLVPQPPFPYTWLEGVQLRPTYHQALSVRSTAWLQIDSSLHTRQSGAQWSLLRLLSSSFLPYRCSSDRDNSGRGGNSLLTVSRAQSKGGWGVSGEGGCVGWGVGVGWGWGLVCCFVGDDLRARPCGETSQH